MKNHLKFAIDISKQTIEDLKTKKVGVGKAKAIAMNVGNIIRAVAVGETLK